MRGMMVAITLAALAVTAVGQTAQKRGAASSKAMDDSLQRAIDLRADHLALKAVFSKMADAGREPINVAVNWPALAEAGIARDLPISLRFHEVTLEDAIRAVLTAAGAGKLNYVVSPGVVEITTNAEIGKHAEMRFYDLSGPLKNTFAPVAGEMARQDDQGFLREFLRLELARVGERVDGPDRELAVKDNVLAATTSPRGHAAIGRALAVLANPTRPGQYAPGTAVSVAAKKAEESLNTVLASSTTPSLAAIAANLSEQTIAAANLNVLLLPGTDEELHRATPALSDQISSAGIVFIGPAATMHAPAVLAVYDMRDVLRRAAARSGAKPLPLPASLVTDAIAHVTSKVTSTSWGAWGKAETTLAPYHGLLVVFAPAAAQREVSAALLEFAR